MWVSNCFGGFGVFFNQIPLINQNHNPFMVSLCEPENILNLAVKSTLRITNHQTNIRSAQWHGRSASQSKILSLLSPLLCDEYQQYLPRLNSKPKRLYLVSIESRVVPSNISHDVTIFPNQSIDKGRFPSIWATNHRKSRQSTAASTSSTSGNASTNASSKSPVPLPLILAMV